MKTAQWADVFPKIKNSCTSDSRIFQTPWEKVSNSPQSPKEKTFFACVVGGTCYGVTVTRKWSADAEKECLDALGKMQEACYHFEHHGEWPKEEVESNN